MNAENWIDIIAGTALGLSALLTILYAIRVVRHSRDHLRWAFLLLLGALTFTNFLSFWQALDHSISAVFVAILRVFVTAVLVWATWPLVKDSYDEFKAWLGLCWSRRSKEEQDA